MPVFVMVGYSQITPIKGWTTDCFRLDDKVILICHLRSLGLYARLYDGWVFTNNAHKGWTTDCFRLNDKVVSKHEFAIGCMQQSICEVFYIDAGKARIQQKGIR